MANECDRISLTMAEPVSPSDKIPERPIPTPPISPSSAPDLRFSDNSPASSNLPPKPVETSPPFDSRPTPPPPPRQPIAPTPPKEYTSTIRTMADDIAKLKVGQQPTGTNLQKSVTPSPQPVPSRPPILPVTLPRPIPSPANVPPSNLPGLRPLTPQAPSPVPPPLRQTPAPAPLSQVPEILQSSSKRPRTILYLLIVFAVLLVGAVYLYLGTGGDPEIVVSPIPTETVTPIPITRNLSAIFGTSSSIILGGTVTELLSSLNQEPISGGELKPITISSLEGDSVGDSSFNEVFTANSISYPNQINGTLGSDAIILLFGQREIFDAKGQLIPNSPTQKRLVFIAEVTDPITLGQILAGWETSMTGALTGIFELSPAKAASPNFLTNVYQETTIKYRNFPYADRSIDYTVVTSVNTKSYFIISNSRESIYTALEELR